MEKVIEYLEQRIVFLRSQKRINESIEKMREQGVKTSPVHPISYEEIEQFRKAIELLKNK